LAAPELTTELGTPAQTAVADGGWPAAFEEILRANLPLLEDGGPMTADLSLAAQGLDSLGTVSLLLALEERYSVSVPDELLNVSTFATPGQLWAVFQRLGASDG
jgi:acyl carrier protein